MDKIARNLSGILILLISLLFLVWSFWDFGYQTRSFIIDSLTTEFYKIENAHVDIADRELLFRWPVILKKGETKKIEMIINAMDEAVERNSSVPKTSSGEDIRNNYYADANIDINRVQVMPTNQIIMSIHPKENTHFAWNIRGSKRGLYQGVVWLNLNVISHQGGSDTRIPITAQPVQIRVVDIVGLDIVSVRILGGLGTLLGAYLILISVLRSNSYNKDDIS